VEVKTTQFGALTPFFASRAEVAVSSEYEGQFQLYRLFHFHKGPKLFALPGSLRQSCRLLLRLSRGEAIHAIQLQ
jgi:hypothetical protein